MSLLQPITSSKRIDLVDALRGFAIFGILMVNMPAFFKPSVEVIMLPSIGNTTVEMLSTGFILFFFAGKFFVLFSLLFGFGFYVFLHKDGEREPSKRNLGLFRRRLFWLLIIAILHISLLWEGDILFYYALLGFLLLLFRKSSTKKIITWMMVFLLIPIVFVGLISMLPSIFASNPEAMQALEKGNQEQLLATQELVSNAYNVYGQGFYSEIIEMNIRQWLFLLSGIIVFYPTCMVMFLMGLLIGRSGFFARTKEYTPQLKKIFWVSLPIGVLLNAGLILSIVNASPAALDYWAFVGRTTGILGGIVMMGTYVSGFILLYNQGKFQKLFAGLSAVGRMALTNYITHSLIALGVFRCAGFGLFGRVEVWQGILLVGVIIGLQIVFSRWWLNTFHFGPLEWLWRTLTYGKIQPMKK